MTPPALWPRLMAGVVLVLAVVFALLPAFPASSATKGPGSFPARIANYSYLTGDVASSPPGRALALFQHGFGVEFMDFPQAVMLGANDDVYRRVRAAEIRGGAETQGDPGPMLLSPDGTRIAVGDYNTNQPNIALIDLDTGRSQEHPVSGGHSIIPLAWSPDSRLLAYLSSARPHDKHIDAAIVGSIGILDVFTVESRLLPGGKDARAAAFSPDGTELAVHRIHATNARGVPLDFPQWGGGVIEVVGLDGAVERELLLPGTYYLDGPNAWSPDGALIATSAQSWGCSQMDAEWNEEWNEEEWERCIEAADAISFIDASGTGAPVPPTLRAGQSGSHGVLGWMAPREILVLDDVTDTRERGIGAPGTHWLTALTLEGGPPRRLSVVPPGDDYGIGDFGVAQGLITDAQVRGAGFVDRGLPSVMVRLVSAVLLAGTALVIGTRWSKGTGT